MAKVRKPRSNKPSAMMIDAARRLLAELEGTYGRAQMCFADGIGCTIELKVSVSRTDDGETALYVEYERNGYDSVFASQRVKRCTEEEFKEWLITEEAVLQVATELQSLYKNTKSWN